MRTTNGRQISVTGRKNDGRTARRPDDGEREQYPNADRRRREPDDYWAQSRRQESRRQERSSPRKLVAKKAVARKAVAESLRRESLRQESLRQESLRQENLRQDSRRQDDRVPEKYRETMMTAAIATGTTSRRFRGKALPIAKTIAVLASRITKSRAPSALPARREREHFVSIMMKAMWETAS